MRALIILCVLIIASVCAMQKTLIGTLAGASDVPIQDMDLYSGRKNVIIHRFGCMDNSTGFSWYNWVFGEMLTHWNQGRVTHFSWDPSTYCNTGGNDGTGQDSGTLVIRGFFDASITNFISRLKTFISGPDGVFKTADDRRIYLRFAHELNGNWYAWSANSTSFVLMWKYVWNKFNDAGFNSSQVAWVWEPVAPYAPDANHYHLLYYPGDQYVDWFSLDGYNWARVHWYGQLWYTPAEIYDDMLFNLRKLNPAKPIMISEVGCATVGSTVANKNSWLTSWYSYAVTQNIAMVLYFNTDADGADWTVFGGNNGTSQWQSSVSSTKYWVFSGYKSAVVSYAYNLTKPTSARILTDDEWYGRLPGYSTRPATQPKIIYDDQTKNDWTVSPAGLVISSLTNTSPVRSGTYSVKLDMTNQNYGSAQIHHSNGGFNTTQYHGFEFYFNPGICCGGNFKFQLKFFSSGYDYPTTLPFSNVATLKNNTWSRIYGEFSSFSIPTNTMVLGFYIQVLAGGNQGYSYVDDFRLFPNNYSWPSGWK